MSQADKLQSWLEADWPAPSGIHGGTTTRLGGHSAAPYTGFNLGDHVGDDAQRVGANRARLRALLGLPAEPCWLRQEHGRRIARAGPAGVDDVRADAVLSTEVGVVCAVLTADCLPLLLCDRTGTHIAAVHAGWRGLAAGVIGAAIEAFPVAPGDLLAWIGPAIGAAHYEVGKEVAEALSGVYAGAAQNLRPGRTGHWYADLPGLARGILRERGVGTVCGGTYCTYEQEALFYSHRRDGQTGRMATLVWRDADPC